MGKWESRVFCGISKQGGKVVFLTFPPRAFSTAFWGAEFVCVRGLQFSCALVWEARFPYQCETVEGLFPALDGLPFFLQFSQRQIHHF